MAKLPRVKQKILAANAPTAEVGQFGSLAAGSPTLTKDLNTIQSLPQFLQGLYAVTANRSEPPRIQDINALYYLITSQLAYLMEQGVPEWDATTEYWGTTSLCQVGGKIYRSLRDNLNKPPASNALDWTGIDAGTLDGQNSAYYRNAANLTGTLADARLSSNVPLKNADNVFDATKTQTTGRHIINIGSNFNSGSTQGRWVTGFSIGTLVNLKINLIGFAKKWTTGAFFEKTGFIGTITMSRGSSSSISTSRQIKVCIATAYNDSNNMFHLEGDTTGITLVSFSSDGADYYGLRINTDTAPQIRDARVTINGLLFEQSSPALPFLITDSVGAGITTTAVPLADQREFRARLNASDVIGGTLPDAQLSSNVPLKDADNTFSATATQTTGRHIVDIGSNFNIGTKGIRVRGQYVGAGTSGQAALLLLAEVYVSGGGLQKTGFIGEIVASRGSTGSDLISNRVFVNVTTGFTSGSTLQIFGDTAQLKLVRVTYNTVDYWAVQSIAGSQRAITIDGLLFEKSTAQTLPFFIPDATVVTSITDVALSNQREFRARLNASDVIGGTLPDAQLSDLVYRRRDYSGNLDSIAVDGIYRLTSGATSLPSGTSADGSFVKHFRWDANTSHQEFTNVTTNQRFVRSRSPSGWAAWVKDWNASNDAPLAYTPQTATGRGQWAPLIVSGGNVTLPANGTWAYFGQKIKISLDVVSQIQGVAAGGTNVTFLSLNEDFTGFAWRIA